MKKYILVGLLALLSLSVSAATVPIKISEYPATTAIGNTDLLLLASGSTNKNIAYSNLVTQLRSNSVYGSNVVGTITTDNIKLSAPQWVDVIMNYGYSVTGPSAPPLTAVSPGSVIQSLAFDNNDILYAQAQFPHNIATTNASFPNFYFEPHIHFTTVGTLDTTHSNVTWRVEWELGQINGTWTKGTNSATHMVTANDKHFMLELGHITNAVPQGISTIFRCRLTRPASVSLDYSNAHDVILDGFDLHVPVGNVVGIGSRQDSVQ